MFKRIVLLCSFCFVFACFISPNQVPAQDDTTSLQMEYMRLAQPGPAHQNLAKLEGKWAQVVKLWPEPGAEAMVFEGTATNVMILGGRFLKSEAVSGAGEMRTESLSILGYDNRYGEYTIVGFDTWGTYFVTAQGPMLEDGRTVVMSGSDTDPVMGFDQEYDMVMKFEGVDKFTTEIIFRNPELTGGEDSFKMVEIVNTRIK